jgi:undecaprenyl-phosphate galactose phosphotransferase/putative colanic acid biosynthesis UDP-glucose lipid carrier transferase
LGYSAIPLLWALTEASIVSTCAFISAILYTYVKTNDAGSLGVHVSLSALVAFVYLGIAHHLKLYQVHEILRGYHTRVLLAWSLTIGAVTLLLFAFKMGNSVSRVSSVGLALAAAICLTMWRGAAARHLKHAFETGSIRGRSAILFGTGAELTSCTPRDLLLKLGVEEVDRIGFAKGASDTEVTSAIKRIVWTTRTHSAPEILLAVAWDDARLDLIRRELRRLPVPVWLLPDCSVAALLSGSWSMQTYVIALQRAPLRASERILKRVLDLVVACTALLILSPLIAFSAVAVKLESRGPVIFKQRRKGFNERKFYIYKFRTMKVTEDGPGIVQAKEKDIRVTRVGRVLRESSIDELPQLVNVIKGEMSVVGPRPHAVAHDAAYCRIIANYAMRHHVKPGITGLAQVNGFRGETPKTEQMAKRVELDIAYINNWSLGLDLKIMLRTAFAVINSRNAY